MFGAVGLLLAIACANGGGNGRRPRRPAWPSRAGARWPGRAGGSIDHFPQSAVALNLPVLAFSVALCLLTTLVFGLVHSAGAKLADTLKEAARGGGGSRRLGWLRGGLVVLVNIDNAAHLGGLGAGLLIARAAGTPGYSFTRERIWQFLCYLCVILTAFAFFEMFRVFQQLSLPVQKL